LVLPHSSEKQYNNYIETIIGRISHGLKTRVLHFII